MKIIALKVSVLSLFALLTSFAQAKNNNWFNVTLSEKNITLDGNTQTKKIRVRIQNNSFSKKRTLRNAKIYLSTEGKKYYSATFSNNLLSTDLPPLGTRTFYVTVERNQGIREDTSELVFTNTIKINDGDCLPEEVKSSNKQSSRCMTQSRIGYDGIATFTVTIGQTPLPSTTYKTQLASISSGNSLDTLSIYHCQQNTFTSNADDANYSCSEQTDVYTNAFESMGVPRDLKMTRINQVQYMYFLLSYGAYSQLYRCTVASNGSCIKSTITRVYNGAPATAHGAFSIQDGKALLSQSTGTGIENIDICDLGSGTCTPTRHTITLARISGTEPSIGSDIVYDPSSSNYIYVTAEEFTGTGQSGRVQRCLLGGGCSLYNMGGNFGVDRIIGLSIKSTTPRRIATVKGLSGNTIVECSLDTTTPSDCSTKDVPPLDGPISRRITALKYDDTSNRLYVLITTPVTDNGDGLGYYELNEQGKITGDLIYLNTDDYETTDRDLSTLGFSLATQ